MDILAAIAIAAINGEILFPKISKSSRYKHWLSIEDLKRCFECKENNGKIWAIAETPKPTPPAHPFCRCRIIELKAIKAGTATIKNTDGADWWIVNKGE